MASFPLVIMNKQQIIEKLSLEPHIEGGYFSRTYSSNVEARLPPDSKPRRLMSSIFYMLTDDSPIGHLHKNKSDIVHYFHAGSPLTYFIVDVDGRLDTRVLGPDLDRGQQLQLIVPGGCWKATLLEAGEFGLISEAVAPGFEYEDMELAQAETIQNQFPHLWPRLVKYVR
jgi:predicted cupin superfamily sugar epimerase